MNEFELFVVSGVEDGLLAVLPNQALIAPMHRQQLSREFYLLRDADYPQINLDLQALAFIDSHFLGQLVMLARNLGTAGRRLTVEASPEITNLLRIARLDQLFEVK